MAFLVARPGLGEPATCPVLVTFSVNLNRLAVLDI